MSRSYIPGRIKKRDLALIRQLNKEFLDSITEKPEETARRDECMRKWLASTGKGIPKKQETQIS